MFYRGKLVLVTGGTGFVGRHFVEELLRQGARVRVSVHRRPLPIHDERLDVVTADLSKLEDCLTVTKGVDYVIHAAGAVGAAGVHPMPLIRENLVLTAQMLEAAWSSGVERFLLFSSSTTYPAVTDPVREEDMWTGPPHPAYAGYGWMRRYLERLGEFVASTCAVGIALVRPTAVYGRWDNFDPETGHVVPALIRKAVERQHPYEVWGSGEEVRDFLHVTDLVRGSLLLLETHATCDPVNIGSGRGATIREIVGIILRAAGYEDATVVFDTSKPTTIPFRAVDVSKARKLLGFVPQVSLEEGLVDAVRWFAQRLRQGREVRP